MKQRVTDLYKRLTATNILSNFINLSSIQISNLLLLLITIRLIAGNVGFEAFGLVMFAYRFSMLAGTVVSYGTSQSGIKDIATNIGNTANVSAVFCNTLSIRLIIFMLFICGMAAGYFLHAQSYKYLLPALPVVLAEVLNPLCFFIGIEKIRVFNIANLISNILAAIGIYFFINTPAHAIWVNFILGMANVITYLGLLIYFFIALKIKFVVPKKSDLKAIGKANFFLTANAISANLQQSVIIFALEGVGSNLLGAYALADRFIGQCRNVLNTISNAVYPTAVNLCKQNVVLWDTYRKRSKYLFAGLFLGGAIIIFFMADLIIFILSKQHDANAVLMLRVMAFVPIVSALNVFSVLDMLLKNKNVYLFKVAIALVCLSAAIAFSVAQLNNILLIGAFTLMIELCAWAMYEYIITKPVVNHA